MQILLGFSEAPRIQSFESTWHSDGKISSQASVSVFYILRTRMIIFIG